MSNDKVGSSKEAAAEQVKGKDFGVHADDSTEAQYVSQDTAKRDDGHGTTRAGSDGERTAGVGGNDSGRGSSSGGDIDTGADALIGIGDKNQHPPQELNKSKGTHAAMENETFGPPDGNIGEDSESAADVNNETKQGNSFKGDVTADEATGGA